MGKGKKRSKKWYFLASKRARIDERNLSPGMTGFICTCNIHERDCVLEAYNILNEFADKLYGKEEYIREEKQSEQRNVAEDSASVYDGKESERNKASEGIHCKESEGDINETGSENDSEDDALDVEAAIKVDVLALKMQNQQEKKTKVKRRFQQVRSGAKNLIFIQTTLEDPVPLSVAIMDEILCTGMQRTKRLLRMIPVQAVCKANPEDIQKTVRKLAETYLEKDGTRYYIQFKCRNNDSVKQEKTKTDIITTLQELNSKMEPDLVTPEVVLNVDVIRNICCLSFLPDYFTKYAKYNLVEIANRHTNEGKKYCAEEQSLGKQKEEEKKSAEQEKVSVLKLEGMVSEDHKIDSAEEELNNS